MAPLTDLESTGVTNLTILVTKRRQIGPVGTAAGSTAGSDLVFLSQTIVVRRPTLRAESLSLVELSAGKSVCPAIWN